MPAIDASTLLRAGLLQDVSVLLAGGEGGAGPVPAALREAFAALGARVRSCELLAGGAEATPEQLEAAVASALAREGRIDMLIVAGGEVFAGAGGGPAGLRVCAQSAWNVTRAVAGQAFIPRGEGGRIAYIAPAPSAGTHARAARAGLENLARTLSIEWARHAVSVVAIAPGEHADAGELTCLAAYLASQAGAYFSGCLFEVRGSRGGR